MLQTQPSKAPVSAAEVKIRETKQTHRRAAAGSKYGRKHKSLPQTRGTVFGHSRLHALCSIVLNKSVAFQKVSLKGDGEALTFPQTDQLERKRARLKRQKTINA